ncbi:serine hydrolase [Streptomyces sp. NPDC090036]|uniref:serine hydrolase n=1 Tax=Streptomyces sp. NPDC090036 TaxID=3365926 RepID=UPI00380B229E
MSPLARRPAAVPSPSSSATAFTPRSGSPGRHCATAAAGGAVSTAQDLATWIRSLATGKVLAPATQRQRLDSLQAENPDAPDGQKYGYGISHQAFGPEAAMYCHGGELPGFNSFIGHDPDNDVTLVVWTNLTLSPDGRTTAQALLPTLLNQIYTGLDLPTA